MTPQQIRGIVFLASFLAVGCGQEQPANVGKVTGKVTLSGQPVPDAIVTFAPVAAGGTAALGKTDADGSYALSYASGVSGAEIGVNRVTISTYDAGNPDGDPPRAPVPEKVPAIYNSPTKLQVEVKAGENTHDFLLEPGPIVQPSETDAVGGRRARSDGC